MDWLRRNWPDLIIGVALVAVVALIVVTLLSGGSLASLVRRNPPELPLTTTNTAPNPAANTGANTAGSSTPQTAPGATSGANNGATAPTGGVDVFVPGIPGGQAGTATGVSGGQAQANALPGAAGAQTASGGLAQGSAAPVNTGPLPEATQSGGFRVAAGAVDSRDAAANLAGSFREANYTVTVEQQNNLYLLWVGPYTTRADADRVAARLQTDGLVPDALVYSYSGPNSSTSNSNASGPNSTNPGSSSGGAVAANPGNPAANTNAAANASTNTATNTGPNAVANTGAAANTNTGAGNTTAGASGPRYLQVGAFVSDASAQPLRAQLEALGFSVTRRVSDTGLVRLLVGPFNDAQLSRTQARLTNEGVPDAFPVTP